MSRRRARLAMRSLQPQQLLCHACPPRLQLVVCTNNHACCGVVVVEVEVVAAAAQVVAVNLPDCLAITHQGAAARTGAVGIHHHPGQSHLAAPAPLCAGDSQQQQRRILSSPHH